VADGLQANVLVLNRLWQAVNVVNGRRAIALLYVGRGRAVDERYALYTWDRWENRSQQDPPDDAESRIATTRGPVRVPRVIQLQEYDRVPRPRLRFTRSNVYRRDRHRCQYCGCIQPAADLTLDHVLPRSRGGPTNWRNIVVSCVGCNARKADRNPDEAGMPLLRQPQAPDWHPTTALRLPPAPHPLWRPFLGSSAP
jgi:5-methylcytosine-specific restriction endonuclease McrA